MNTMQTFRRTHPMVLVAAVAVTAFSIIGSAALTGLIPLAHSEKNDVVQVEIPDSKSAQTSVSNKFSGKSASNSTNPERSTAKDNSPQPGSGSRVAICSKCGVIESIRMVQHDGEGSGLGAVAGGVTGGVVGNQIGKGKGNVLMTIIGMGGGAYAGHTIEKKMKSYTAYVVKVHMEDGTYRSITQSAQPEYAVGDHVKVISGRVIDA